MLMLKKLAMVVMVMLSIVASPSLSAEVQDGYFGDGFLYHGFKDPSAKFRFQKSVANVTDDGLLRLTNNLDGNYQIGHAFFSNKFQFKNNVTKQNSSSSSNTSTSGNVFSFSTTFVFSIIPENPGLSGQGIAFVIAPKGELPGARSSTYLGLFNSTNNGDETNHVVAVELDTIYNTDFDNIRGEHIGIDINDLKSTISAPSGYTDDNGRFHNLSLISGYPIQVWVEYDGFGKKLNVTIAPNNVRKPDTPLISYDRDLSDVILDNMFVGFSSSTSFVLTSHYIMGWSFKINGRAPPLNLKQLPQPPRKKASKSKLFGVELPIIIPVILLTFIIGILVVVRKIRNEKFKDVVEDWELDYGRQRRPIEMHKSETEEGEVLVDWVLYCWRSGRILQTSDPNLVNEYVKEEMELVLKIGLLCSRNNPKARPSMRQVMQYLDGDVPFPETELWGLDYDDNSMSSSSGERPSHVIEMVSLTTSSRSTSVAESLLSGPR
ncbi:hypothetical protein MKW98_019754 [Papaver atlanticum]|uniref:non-specific serine/threonine protein kinase n=1 Tax=Papaver atlanticum TaxID=357466 RepID=A0AAD4TH16_9MAGN|nr:hypothetical protein MKW98_019754 [Papaver atlanticum]